MVDVFFAGNPDEATPQARQLLAPAVAGRPTAGLEEAGNRLADALEEQRTLWELAQPDLDALDRSYFRVRFMSLHDPIGSIDRALATWHAALEAHRAAATSGAAVSAGEQTDDLRGATE